jgi:spermidine synthase
MILEDDVKPAVVGLRDAIAILCFFVSGFVGLVYEICWVRKASLSFGSTTLAVSTVIAVFFGGLALGSYIFGRYSQRTTRPLKVYAGLEIGLGILILLNPAMFTLAEGLYGALYPSLSHSFALLSLSRFILVTVLILPPTILMGGTLPLFSRQYVVRQKTISRSVGLLYGINTLGAALGSMVCGFYLIPHIGITRTIWLGGLINIFIGLTVGGMQILSKYLRQMAIPSSSLIKPDHHTAPAGRDAWMIYGLFFLSGFTALGNEILWARYLSLIIHNTVYTYTLTLTVTLTGIVLGSILISFISDRTSRRALIFGAVHVLIGLSVLTVLLLPPDTWKGFIDTQDFFSLLMIFLTVLLLPAILSGISFPLAIRMVVRQPMLAGVGVGKMAAINTVGGIVGSLAVGFMWIPLLGLHDSLLVSTAISLSIGAAAWLLLERTVRLSVKIAMVVSALLVWLAIPSLLVTRLPQDFLGQQTQLVDFREGLRSHLAVVKTDDNLVLEIDRLWQGQKKKTHQIMAAHIPMLLHRHPRDILVVGMGVGQTASRFLMYNVETVDCVDIERELFDLVRTYFDTGWLADPRVNLIVEDGRNYMAHTERKYDLISIEIGQIFRPGLASFYTCDFYRQVRRRLKKNGMAAQFLPIGSFGPHEFRAVIRSFLEVFPRSVLWYKTSEFLLIGSADAPLRVTSGRLQLLENHDAVHRDLEFAYWDGPKNWLNRPEVFLAGFLCGPQSLDRLTVKSPVYSDDLPVLEYATASYQRKWLSHVDILRLIQPYLDSPQLILTEKLDPSTLAKIKAIRQQNLKMAKHF